MYKYNIYIGMFDKDTKQQELSNTDFFNTVRKVMRLHNINCYSIYKCKGHFQHEDGTIVCEPSINVEFISNVVYHQLSKTTSDIKKQLCELLNQESVLITKQEIQIL